MAKRYLTPDDEIGQLLAHRLQRATVATGEVCADAETLASYVDDGMSAKERAGWEAHFATCARCRRALALMARLKETASPELAGESWRDPTSTRGNLWVLIPLAACVLVAAGLWFATRPADGTFVASTPTAQTATQVAQSSDTERPSAPPALKSPASASTGVPQPTGALQQETTEKRAERREVAAQKDASVGRAYDNEAAKKVHGDNTRKADSASTTPSAPAPAASTFAAAEVQKPGVAAAAAPATSEAPKPQAVDQAGRFRAGQRQQESAAGAKQGQVTSGPTAQQIQQPAQQGAVADRRDVPPPPPAAPAPARAPAAATGGVAGAGGTAAGAAAGTPSPPEVTNATTNATRVNVANDKANGPTNTTNATGGGLYTPADAAARAKEEKTLADKVRLAAAELRERDAISPTERAEGLIVRVSDPAGPARSWRVFKFGRIEVTHDGGGTWTNEMPQLNVTFATAETPAPGVCWVVGSKGSVWRLALEDGSTDSGWQARAVPTDEDLVSVKATSARDAIVVTRSGQQFGTHDGGKSWTRQ